ncbi:BrnT family toxin [Devosia salina]|uniref:BrnT family toxin n=1 Tax=Devosia salina TaxID=2860336 RepID=A0ABX8WHZ4_9HYPH|nr:BrnT family toxin [Devosia salina]QYO77117.1 BrnT family toxin [Devosia salina]
MDFEWDDAKNEANVLKHGIDFADAVFIFRGPIVTWSDLRVDYGEMREISTGRMANTVIVTVVHTDRTGRRRIISARRASRRERIVYETSI